MPVVRQQRAPRDRRQKPLGNSLLVPLIYLRYVSHTTNDLVVQLTPNDLAFQDRGILPLMLQRGPEAPTAQVRADSFLTLTYPTPLIDGDTFTMTDYSRAITDGFGAVVVPGSVVIATPAIDIPQFLWTAAHVDAYTSHVDALDGGQTIYCTNPNEWVSQPTGFSATSVDSTPGVPGITLHWPADASGDTAIEFVGTIWQAWASYGTLITPALVAYP